VANLLVFGSLFVALYLAGVLTMAACGYDLATTLSAPASAICNVGPGLGQVGPTTHWGHLPDAAKWVMSALMLLGRLEIFSILVLVTPWAWKR
jgi:trk system potassium uptake protein TrkH